MDVRSYYGAYARFDTASKKDGALLMNADCIVGDRYEVEIDLHDGTRTAWLKNRFGSRVGFFDDAVSYELSLCAAKGWKAVASLSFVAFSEQPEPGIYWGEAAVVSYDPACEDVVEPFVDRVRALLAQGIRPEVTLGQVDLDHLQANPEAWMPAGRAAMPAKERGTVVLKSREKFSEKLIEQGRKKNVGCYIVSWAFLLALVALLMFSLHSCGVF